MFRQFAFFVGFFVVAFSSAVAGQVVSVFTTDGFYNVDYKHVLADKITFAKGSSRPNSFKLEKVVRALHSGNASSVIVLGFSDPSGSAASNLKLSFERAKAVADDLKSLYGFKGKILLVEGFGETDPFRGFDFVPDKFVLVLEVRENSHGGGAEFGSSFVPSRGTVRPKQCLSSVVSKGRKVVVIDDVDAVSCN